MRRSRCRGSLPGYVLIIIGMAIILSLVLPAGFWWFAVGAGLIALGAFLNMRC